MKRNRDKSLPLLPVLIPTTVNLAEGKSSSRPVRVLPRNERTLQSLTRQLPLEQVKFLAAVGALRKALHRKDRYGINAACVQIQASGVEDISDVIEAQKLGIGVITLLMSAVTEWLSKFLSRAKLVYWVRLNEFEISPGIYCPDAATALAVDVLIYERLRICPHCQKIYVVEHPKQQPCCSRRCTDAYRVARFRGRKKQKGE